MTLENTGKIDCYQRATHTKQSANVRKILESCCICSMLADDPATYTMDMMTSSNGNISSVTGPLWGESTGHRWILLTKTDDAELWCFLWYVPEQTVVQTTETPVVWGAIALSMTSLEWIRINDHNSLMLVILQVYFTLYSVNNILNLKSWEWMWPVTQRTSKWSSESLFLLSLFMKYTGTLLFVINKNLNTKHVERLNRPRTF